MRRFIALVFIAAVALAGCGSEKPMKGGADTPPSAAASSSTKAEDKTGPCKGSKANFDDWDVVVTEVDTNANDTIRKANDFNDKPKSQYILITYKATYKGNDRKASVDVGLHWTLTGKSQVILEPAYQVTPYSEKPTDARKGGTITQQVLFDASPRGALLSVETFPASQYAECRL